MKTKLNAFKASSPAMLGYITLGLSFGFLFQKAGAIWYLAPLMSLIVYAGAAQFIAITLLLNHASLLQILSATFFVNLRHIFYGLSFLGRFPTQLIKKLYMIFGLTDESYAILSAHPLKNSSSFDFYVILFSHGYWIVGSVLGALIGHYLTINLSFLSFSLTALFVVLAIEQTVFVKRYSVFFIAAIVITLSVNIFPKEMLMSALIMSTGLLLFFYLLENQYVE